ncbi:hypothetical protein Ae201684_000809 [Aphanomyces euteiches]|uniref:Uncharacterized protein n=1 Tax=Aphanomyces euteiches TaxID=100861 RepID=A0A6G0XUH0_9STRA|nr:hypothetical protein Ae201684_000809 [Aphanomyces euteiches]KAH9135790.1 hypothetical protein AeRB84_018876 [Aphanomyces euteiches]
MEIATRIVKRQKDAPRLSKQRLSSSRPQSAKTNAKFVGLTLQPHEKKKRSRPTTAQSRDTRFQPGYPQRDSRQYTEHERQEYQGNEPIALWSDDDEEDEGQVEMEHIAPQPLRTSSSDLKMLVVQAILQREECVATLQDGVLEGWRSPRLWSLLAPLRLYSLAAVEAIVQWKVAAGDRCFLWKGESYLRKMAHDASFLDGYLSNDMGFSLDNNPFISSLALNAPQLKLLVCCQHKQNDDVVHCIARRIRLGAHEETDEVLAKRVVLASVAMAKEEMELQLDASLQLNTLEWSSEQRATTAIIAKPSSRLESDSPPAPTRFISLATLDRLSTPKRYSSSKPNQRKSTTSNASLPQPQESRTTSSTPALVPSATEDQEDSQVHMDLRRIFDLCNDVKSAATDLERQLNVLDSAATLAMGSTRAPFIFELEPATSEKSIKLPPSSTEESIPSSSEEDTPPSQHTRHVKRLRRRKSPTRTKASVASSPFASPLASTPKLCRQSTAKPSSSTSPSNNRKPSQAVMETPIAKPKQKPVAYSIAIPKESPIGTLAARSKQDQVGPVELAAPAADVAMNKRDAEVRRRKSFDHRMRCVLQHRSATRIEAWWRGQSQRRRQYRHHRRRVFAVQTIESTWTRYCRQKRHQQRLHDAALVIQSWHLQLNAKHKLQARQKFAASAIRRWWQTNRRAERIAQPDQHATASNSSPVGKAVSKRVHQAVVKIVDKAWETLILRQDAASIIQSSYLTYKFNQKQASLGSKATGVAATHAAADVVVEMYADDSFESDGGSSSGPVDENRRGLMLQYFVEWMTKTLRQIQYRSLCDRTRLARLLESFGRWHGASLDQKRIRVAFQAWREESSLEKEKRIQTRTEFAHASKAWKQMQKLKQRDATS